jgi:hypothetical protein
VKEGTYDAAEPTEQAVEIVATVSTREELAAVFATVTPAPAAQKQLSLF